RTEPQIVVERGKKVEKGESNRISLDLYKQGKTVQEIAAERSLAASTIEGHLAEYVVTGEVNILDLLDKDLLEEIKTASEGVEEGKLSPIKEKLGEKASYGQIKMVVNYLKGLGVSA
ncbi:MAG TPA: helix-turn-helix domain-containing protein, partial [Bacteroidia bacterium]|nr:helix-turn-helix domain-containing protein [Bacteroidia bacterium]